MTKPPAAPTPEMYKMWLSIWRCVETTPFTTAAGLRANRKINLDRIPEYSEAFRGMVGGLVLALADTPADLVIAVPNGANRFARGAAHELGLPYVNSHKEGNAFVYDQDPRAKGIIIVEDVRSTGKSVLKAAEVWGVERVVKACAIIDRGIDVASVKTVDEACSYATKHPEEPPAHIQTPFAYDRLLHAPLPLMEHSLPC